MSQSISSAYEEKKNLVEKTNAGWKPNTILFPIWVNRWSRFGNIRFISYVSGTTRPIMPSVLICVCAGAIMAW